jgi:hypothetical protein
MKFVFVLAAASALASHAVMAAPFATQRSTVVATKIGYKSVEYTVGTGQTRNGIKVPVVGRPVQMMVSDVTPYYQGLGEVTLFATTGLSLTWTGTDVASDAESTPAIDHGSAQAKGTHIMWADYSSSVDVRVENQDTIEIHNGTGEAQSVIVTFIW